MLLILNLPLLGLWVALLRVPYQVLFPAIIAFCAIGVYSVANEQHAVYQITVFGLLGYVLLKLECELPPFILGFILGPMLEEHLRRAMIISSGDPSVFFTRPISGALLAVAVITLIVVCMPYVSQKRKQVFVED
jgi:TctA family transporter